jgi:hypothetical protein
MSISDLRFMKQQTHDNDYQYYDKMYPFLLKQKSLILVLKSS